MKITSIKDPIVQEARKLQSASYRREVGKVLLYGIEQIEWAFNSFLVIESIFITVGYDPNAFTFSCKDKLIEVSEGILKKISATTYVVPVMGVAKVGSIVSCHNDFTVVMDNLQDFGNIGSIIRTAQGFSIDRFLFTNMQTDPFMRKVIEASRGLVFHSKIIEHDNVKKAIEYLKATDHQIVVTSPHARHLQSQIPLLEKKIALVIGNETSGVSSDFVEAADAIIQVPLNLQVESLNASVFAGISMYELKFKQVLIMLQEKILTSLGRQVGITSKWIRMALDKEISYCTDLSGMHIILMMIMYCDKNMTIEQIAQDTAIAHEQLPQWIGLLESKRFIIKREKAYSLTEKGGEFLAEMWPVIERTHQKIFAEISEQEIHLFNQILSKIQSGCKKIIGIEHGK